jgi:hypothetical protein
MILLEFQAPADARASYIGRHQVGTDTPAGAAGQIRADCGGEEDSSAGTLLVVAGQHAAAAVRKSRADSSCGNWCQGAYTTNRQATPAGNCDAVFCLDSRGGSAHVWRLFPRSGL